MSRILPETNARLATEADFGAVLALMFEYLPQTMQGKYRKWSPQVTAKTLSAMFTSEDADALVVVDESDKPIGFACAYYCHSWFDELDLVVEMFYISPTYRRTRAARQLRDIIEQKAKARGCGQGYAGAESGVSKQNSEMYANLFRKAGWQLIGNQLFIDLKGQ